VCIFSLLATISYAIIYLPLTDKRYRFTFVAWLDETLQNHADLRADTSSLADLKHNAKYAFVRFRDSVSISFWERVKRLVRRSRQVNTRVPLDNEEFLTVSVELLSQITTAECMSLVCDYETAWQKIYSKARTLQTVNINRYMFSSKRHVVQDTCLLALAMYVEMHEKKSRMPFPKPAP
jgi:hypothetical protein